MDTLAFELFPILETGVTFEVSSRQARWRCDTARGGLAPKALPAEPLEQNHTPQRNSRTALCPKRHPANEGGQSLPPSESGQFKAVIQ